MRIRRPHPPLHFLWESDRPPKSSFPDRSVCSAHRRRASTDWQPFSFPSRIVDIARSYYLRLTVELHETQRVAEIFYFLSANFRALCGSAVKNSLSHDFPQKIVIQCPRNPDCAKFSALHGAHIRVVYKADAVDFRSL